MPTTTRPAPVCAVCGMPRALSAYRVHRHTVKGRVYEHREKTCRACENFARRVRYWKTKRAKAPATERG